jgi:hypothetical protein
MMPFTEVPALTATEMPQRIDITTDIDTGKTTVIIDGTDISAWIAYEPIVVEYGVNKQPTVNVKLTAPTVTHTIVP